MIKVTKEAIVTSPFDAVADTPSEWIDLQKHMVKNAKDPYAMAEQRKSTELQEPLTFEQMMKRMEAAKNRISNPEHRFGFECAMAVIEAIVPEIEE